MNVEYVVTCLWQNGDLTEAYRGKWHMPAQKAGQQALDKGAVYADMEIHNKGECVKIVPITRYAPPAE